MTALLAAAAGRTGAPQPLRHLLEAIGPSSVAPAPASTMTRTPTPTSDAAVAVAEPLTERETTVLRMLGTDLDGPQIARELVVSVNTVRTHTKNIYAKLGVTNRRAAVRRARELQLLRR